MKKISNTRVFSILLFILSVSPISPAYAVPVTLDGSLFNSNFDLTFDDSMTGLFGNPVVSNNTISFSPDDFSAEAEGEFGFDFPVSLIDLTLTPHAGYSLTSFFLLKEGSYSLSGEGGSVNAGGILTASNQGGSIPDSTIVLVDPIEEPGRQGSSHWSAGAFIDESTGGWSPESDTSVILTISNFLVAQVQDGPGIAFIGEDLASIDVTTVIPLPAALPLFTSALLVFGFIKRKSGAV